MVIGVYFMIMNYWVFWNRRDQNIIKWLDSSRNSAIPGFTLVSVAGKFDTLRWQVHLTLISGSHSP